jgi:hypothetical protein
MAAVNGGITFFSTPRNTISKPTACRSLSQRWKNHEGKTGASSGKEEAHVPVLWWQNPA